VIGSKAASARTSRDISLLNARCSDCTSPSVQANDAISSVISNRLSDFLRDHPRIVTYTVDETGVRRR
jgi:hypothetical protein